MQVEQSGQSNPGATPRVDLLGNRVDASVGYARGNILSSEVDEVRRQKHAYHHIRQRFQSGGDASIHNLTGLIRGFPLQPADMACLPSYLHHVARYHGQLETAALGLLRGNSTEHDCFLSTRVSAGMLAIMLTVLDPGDDVLSLVVDDNSHPSVGQAVRIAGGTFREVVGLEAFEAAYTEKAPPKAVVITTITPTKKHLAQAQTLQAIALAKKHGSLVVLDDAHMAARLAVYGEDPGLVLDADAMVWSLDKHMIGPRSGLVAGKKNLIGKIKARALALGVEAQLGQVLAGWRAIQAFDPEPIIQAQAMAQSLLGEFNAIAQGHAYQAGAGVALAGDRLLQLAIQKSGKQAAIAPIEAAGYVAMRLLDTTGAVTISAVGMPGAACTLRLMLYPDGMRLGQATIIAAVTSAFSELAEGLDQPEHVRKILLG